MNEGILILHAGALGDFVLTWFIARALRRMYPGHEITYVTHPAKGRLGSRFLGTAWNDVQTNGWHTLHTDAPRLQMRARELLDSAQRAICFLGRDLADRLQELAPSMGVSCIEPIPPETWPGHVTRYYLEQLCEDLPCAELEEELASMWSQGVQVTRASSSRVLLHIGAGSFRKCWPTECFMEVAGHLRQQGREVIMIAGEAEMERMPRHVLEQVNETYPLVCPGDYLQLAEELLNAELLVTADNGPGHLAGVLGCKVISLFAPTRAEVWRPVGPGTSVLQAPTMQAISVSRVLDAVYRVLE